LHLRQEGSCDLLLMMGALQWLERVECLWMKENIIGGIFDILHWASWADYIGYIALTPYVGTQYGTIPIYSNIRLQSQRERYKR